MFRRGDRRGLAYPQPVEERQQRQGLTQLIPGAPEDLTPQIGRSGESGPHQRGLPDSRLAIDQYGPASPRRHVRHKPVQYRQLVLAADQAIKLNRGCPGGQPALGSGVRLVIDHKPRLTAVMRGLRTDQSAGLDLKYLGEHR